MLLKSIMHSYRVYAYREAIGSEVDFYSCNAFLPTSNLRFTTGIACLGDFDIDDDIVGKNLAEFIQHLSDGTAEITFEEFCTVFGN